VPWKYRRLKYRATCTKPRSTGTSTSGPITAANAPVVFERFFLGRGVGRKTRRIVESDVQPLHATWKYRAALVGVIADRDHPVKADLQDFVDVFRAVGGDIDTHLAHGN
jgi:hypothetical protein